MKILVTGSAGRVGKKVALRLLELDHEVTGFDLKPARLETYSSYREVIGSFSDLDKASDAIDGAQAVIHLGAFMSWIATDARKMFEANVDGTRTILQSAAEKDVDLFIFASSGEVYPENSAEYLPVDEDHPLHANTSYGLTKLLGEELVRFYQRTTKMDTVILRFSHTQDASELLDSNSFFSGPRFFLHPKIEQQQRFGNDAVVTILKAIDTEKETLVLSRNANGRPFQMHITETRDMIDGILLALENPAARGEAFNLGATQPVDFSVAIEKMSELTRLPFVTVDLPGSGVYYHTSNQKIRETLGYNPIWTLDKMLDEAVSHYHIKSDPIALTT